MSIFFLRTIPRWIQRLMLSLALRLRTTDRLVLSGPWAESWWLQPHSLSPVLTGALRCGKGGSSWLRLSVACWEAEPGASPGSWADPNHMVAIFPQPETALWHQLTAGLSSLSADNGSQVCRTDCAPVIRRRSTAKRVMAVLLLLSERKKHIIALHQLTVTATVSFLLEIK